MSIIIRDYNEKKDFRIIHKYYFDEQKQLYIQDSSKYAKPVRKVVMKNLINKYYTSIPLKNKNNDTNMKVIEYYGKLSGFITYSKNYFPNEEKKFYINYLRSYTKGLGSILLNEIINIARKEGFSEIKLHVACFHDDKLDIYYQKFGFKRLNFGRKRLMKLELN